jgi:hypothetical protein
MLQNALMPTSAFWQGTMSPSATHLATPSGRLTAIDHKTSQSRDASPQACRDVHLAYMYMDNRRQMGVSTASWARLRHDLHKRAIPLISASVTSLVRLSGS